MKPRMASSKSDVDDIRRALDFFYRNKPHSYGLASREQSAYDQYADLISVYAPKKDSVIVDLGCGSWRSPETIASRGFKRVIGLDLFSDKTLEEYRQRRSAQQVELLNYDGVTFPLASSSVDVVSSLCMFEHVINVERLLDESHRILRPGGVHIVCCPNWSGINNAIRGLQAILTRGDRYWQYETVADCLCGLGRSFVWYGSVLVRREPKFLLVFPRMANGMVNFERGDDDVVHLCQPLSFKKYFVQHGYSILRYNRKEGATRLAKVFNTLVPSLATTVLIVARKQERDTFTIP